MNDHFTRQPIDYPAPSLFDEEEYSPLPGLAMVLGIAASLIAIGAAIGWYFCTRGNI